jgi:uncharacterized membrane protein YozB (DUF420 family)
LKNRITPQACLRLVLWLLGFKILAVILIEYRYYFPADFGTAFLIGREDIFVGLYRIAFYIHIIVGPFCLILAALLFVTGVRQYPDYFRISHQRHRQLGQLQAVLVLVMLLPSGLVMAPFAFAGPIAATGFAAQSILTAMATVLAIASAMRGNIQRHRRWAMWTLLLLASPLLFRFLSGLLVAAEWESDRTYQLNAWGSWLVPLALFELSRFSVPKVDASIARITRLTDLR